MSGSINAVPDPAYSFDKGAPVLITVGDDSSNPLLAKHFINRAVLFMREKGFQRVYTEENQPKAKNQIKLLANVDINTRTTAHKYRSADYANVQTGTTTECKTTSNH